MGEWAREVFEMHGSGCWLDNRWLVWVAAGGHARIHAGGRGLGGRGLRSGAGCGLDVLGGKEKREEGSMDFHVGDWGVGRWGGGRKGWRRKGCEELESK